LADPGRAPEAVAIPVVLDGVEHPVGFLDRGGIVVAPQEPEAPVPALVHELAECSVRFERQQRHSSFYSWSRVHDVTVAGTADGDGPSGP
jgi:hypothetical protein